MAFMDSTPWSPHITTTHIEGKELMYTWTTLLTLLRLPCLRTFSIFWAIFLSPTDEQGVVERIVAPELVHFRCFSEAVITHVLHFLQAPKLEVLVLKGEYTYVILFKFPVVDWRNSLPYSHLYARRFSWTSHASLPIRKQKQGF